MSIRSESIKKLRQRIQIETLGDREMRGLARDPRAGVRSLWRQLKKKRKAETEEAERLQRLLAHEAALWNQGLTRVAGVDEAGAGPLAGPVVAAAVILKPGTSIAGIDDSKKLTRIQRDRLAVILRSQAVAWATGLCTPREIDRLNILEAGRLALRRAVLGLGCVPDHLLVDARVIPNLEIPQTSLVGGDGKSQSIAAASILAKVERDAMMETLAQKHPGYGFERHRGYATADHLLQLRKLGPSPAHRRSFAPVRSARK